MIEHRIRTALAYCTTLACATLSQFTLAAEFAPGDKHVALGSSFAAGPGVDLQLGNCGRSTNNYANLTARALGLTLVDVSCNGATTDNILDTPQNGAAPQIEAVTTNTALVTVTIGGNDINYTSSTFACAGTATDEQCTANLDQDAISEAVEQLPGKLTATINAIKERAPQASIVVVTYPRVFPPNAANCSELELSPADTAYLADLGRRLEQAFVTVTQSEEVLIADSYVGEAGHGPCAMPETARWVNGATTVVDGIRYHPTGAGHIEMSRLVLEALED
ncbi:MAG: SGNH/GDSL hydrolase family protein [Gammaproteobacteria bacterium]